MKRTIIFNRTIIIFYKRTMSIMTFCTNKLFLGHLEIKLLFSDVFIISSESISVGIHYIF